MPVSSVTEHWIKQEAITINLNHFGDPDYLQVSVLAGAVVMAFKQDIIGYNAAHNYRTWPLQAANTYLENTSAVNVYARLTRSEVNASALIIYDSVLRDIEGRAITYAENGSEILGNADTNYFYVFLGQISGSIDNNGEQIERNWEVSFRFGNLDTSQYRNEEAGGEWMKMFRLNKVTDMIEVLKTFSSAVFKKLFIGDKEVGNIHRSIDNLEIKDDVIPTTKYTEESYLSKKKDDRSVGRISTDKGFEAGKFVSGFLGGTGAWIGADGYSEMSGLTLREFLEVPELRFNRIDVVSGELWNAIAFGMVEEVDTEKRICKIKLEENERCGLHVGDFCRGIFADFSGGNNWEDEDECRFMHLYGFSTSYFTPKTILENEEGLFRFEYELKPGTTQHPTQSMKFAVYGHPTDTTRQASAYATRTYKRYLNNVNTWVISPDDHIYAQYGDLNGLQINGVTMQGYGSFQSNAYFRGVQIQLPPEQMESLKGDSAYAAQLTSYVGTVKLDADGNMVGGMFEELNVIADGKNVICRDIEQPQTFRNVTTKNYRLTTTVQAYKGTTPLYYSADVAAKGSFTLALACVGCTASVVNGAIIINSITDTKDCRINITVNCEGMAVYNLEYNVVFVQDGKIGEDGKKGADAVSYRIEPNIQTISKTMTGSLEPESVKFMLQANKGGVIKYYDTYWSLKGRNLANGEWTTLKSADGTTSFDVVFTANYKYYELSAKTYGEGDVMLGDTLNISIVADGKDGKDGADGADGASGAMPRYRGEFVFNNESEPYVYDSEYRDIVIYEGNVYQVYMYDSSIIEPPSIAPNADNDGKWQRANKFRFVAMDTALIDSANIGGFMFKRTKYIDNVPVGRLESQYGPVVIREVDKSSSDVVPVSIHVESGNGTTVLTTQIRKTKGDYAYALKPTTRLVTLDKDNNPSVSSISCSLIRKSASGDSSITSIPTGYTLKYSVAGGTEATYTPNNSITVPKSNGSTIEFILRDNYSNIVSKEIVFVFKEESTQSTILYDRYIQFACNDDGSVKFGLPYRFRVSQWQGGKEVPLTNITLSGSGVTIDNERIELDAETGTLKCTNVDLTGVINAVSGNIGDWNISHGSMAVSGEFFTGSFNTEYKNILDITGMHVDYGEGAINADLGVNLVTFSKEGTEWFSALSIVDSQDPHIRRTDLMCGLYVKGNYQDIGLLVEGCGASHILSEKGTTVYGLSLNTKTVTSDYTAATNDDVIIFKNTSNITFKLNSGSKQGKVLYLKRASSYAVTIQGHIRECNSVSGAYDYSVSLGSESVICVFTDSYWTLFYCG